MEEAVRRKHAIERALDDYLKIVATMTREEIEIALGRLEDLYNSSETYELKAECAFKGHVLRSYLELRLSGVRKQQKIRRQLASRVFNSFRERLGKERYDKKRHDYEVALAAWKSKIRVWRDERTSFSTFKKLVKNIDAPPEPSPPIVPTNWKHYTEGESRGKLLIEFAASYSLAPLSPSEEEVSHEDVRLLSP